MITYKISVKDGYMVDSDLPHNCIFNKARTGCGGTSIALNNGENYVVAVPTTELIINKCSSNDRCFGLYGNFTPKLKKELSDYIQQHECRKIICTYDKLPNCWLWLMERTTDCWWTNTTISSNSIHSGTRLLTEY